MDVKQVILIRKDLKCRRGKEIAQGSHASMAFLTKEIRKGAKMDPTLDAKSWINSIVLSNEAIAWIEGSFTKVVCKVHSEEELLKLCDKAREKGLEVQVITDKGLTEFKGVPTITAAAIGPNKVEEIDEVTGSLELY